MVDISYVSTSAARQQFYQLNYKAFGSFCTSKRFIGLDIIDIMRFSASSYNKKKEWFWGYLQHRAMAIKPLGVIQVKNITLQRQGSGITG